MKPLKQLSYWIKRLFLLKSKHRYKVNIHTCEIHDRANPHPNCKTALMTNYRLVDKKTVKTLLHNDTVKYNGCRWCMKRVDTDMKHKKKK